MTIYLYIKQCTHCDLKYFGKTRTEDPQYPYKYSGSGVRWSRHLKAHNIKHPKTLQVFSFEIQREAEHFAFYFSKENNIVESKEWANLQEENAKDGNPEGYVTPQEIKDKISKSLSKENHPNWGKKRSKEDCATMSAAQSKEKHRNWGKHLPQSTKDAISKTMKGLTYSKERRENISKGLKDYHKIKQS